ncbi:hypothetical protein CPC08DRAFT_766306 [Agrocybe pediades]|nr:hypothetical protein CPC08DRAFT_766306 [Agrocybe pediades]
MASDCVPQVGILRYVVAGVVIWVGVELAPKSPYMGRWGFRSRGEWCGLNRCMPPLSASILLLLYRGNNSLGHQTNTEAQVVAEAIAAFQFDQNITSSRGRRLLVTEPCTAAHG